MGLCCQVDDPVEIMSSKELLHESVVGSVFDILKVLQIACVGQGIKVDDVIIGVFADHQADKMRPNKPGTTGNQDCGWLRHVLWFWFAVQWFGVFVDVGRQS